MLGDSRTLASDDRIDPSLRERLREAFKVMMRALYKEDGSSLRIGILAEPAAQEFIGAHADALDSSFRKVKMSDLLSAK